MSVIKLSLRAASEAPGASYFQARVVSLTAR